jgi:hypothetical protein
LILLENFPKKRKKEKTPTHGFFIFPKMKIGGNNYTK